MNSADQVSAAMSSAALAHYFQSSADLSCLAQGLQQVSAGEGVKSMLVFCADGNQYDESALNDVLKAQSRVLMGGIFPQIVYQDQAYEQGCLVIGLTAELHVEVIAGLSDEKADYAEDIDQAFAQVDESETVLVFVDGLAKRISSLVDGLFDVFGAEPDFIGGGAGSLSFEQKPCLFTRQGVQQDCALVGLYQSPSRLAVGHGWTSVDQDHQITRVEKNVIYEIDNRNAFEVYQSAVNAISATPMSMDNFFEVAQAFPFGINKLSGEKIVRDPISVTDEGALICVGELVQGDFVDILSAQPDQLIQAAEETAKKAYATSAQQAPQMTLMMDCISRALFLKQDFSRELSSVNQISGDSVPLMGALVLGEIANSGAGYLEFYNKTTVVASI